jgi:hypothetical protein
MDEHQRQQLQPQQHQSPSVMSEGRSKPDGYQSSSKSGFRHTFGKKKWPIRNKQPSVPLESSNGTDPASFSKFTGEQPFRKKLFHKKSPNMKYRNNRPMKSNRKKQEPLVSTGTDNVETPDKSSSGPLSGGTSLQPVCGVCQSLSPKYKCPKCLVPYCSIACCKNHKEAHHSATTVLSVEGKAEAVTSDGLSHMIAIAPSQEQVGVPKGGRKRENGDTEEAEDLSAFESIVLLTDQQRHKLSHSSELLSVLKSKRLQSHLSSIDSGKTVRERLLSLRLLREKNKEFNEVMSLLLKTVE